MNRRNKPVAKNTDATDIKINEIIADAKRAVIDGLEHDFAWAFEACESPIEKLFAAAMVDPSTTLEFSSRLELLRPKSGLIEHCQAPPLPGVYMWQQIKIGPYRVDFMFDSVGGVRLPMLIVECDGHDFHERTKEQAARDKARDRFLVGRGFRLVRFTGSEIFADPHGAAHQALCILMGIAD